MASIFISHSSKNNAEAEAVRAWLADQGWGRLQVFLDLQDLKTGDRWREVLNDMGDAEAVIVCLSDEWLGSPECQREFNFADRDGKLIFPIFVRPVNAPIPRFISDIQIGDTSTQGLAKLHDQLVAKGIAPQSFRWPPKDEPDRPVYRGLEALDVQDAAIFFGRDADIARALEELRRLRGGAQARMLVILGASGAGKSSFLRAGLLARLEHDKQNFVVLPVIRPERAALSGQTGLRASLSSALGRAAEVSSVEALKNAFAELRRPAGTRPNPESAVGDQQAGFGPTILIPIDQGEELFSNDNSEGPKFCQLMEEAVAQDGNALVVTAIRSDSFAPLQGGLLARRQSHFPLPGLAPSAFKDVIEGPARLAAPPIKVEPALTEHLSSQLSAETALPLLAFTIERLHRQHSAEGALTLAHYQKLGELGGAIRDAVDQAMGAEPDRETIARAKRVFVPNLVRVDQEGVKRRRAAWADLPADAEGLVNRFIEQRILVVGQQEGARGRTLELAHEAILEEWPRLQGWLLPERFRLAALANLEHSAVVWEEGGAQSADLVHRGKRLSEARALLRLADYRQRLRSDKTITAYLRACSAARNGRILRNLLFIVALQFPLVFLFFAFGLPAMRSDLQQTIRSCLQQNQLVEDGLQDPTVNKDEVIRESTRGDCTPAIRDFHARDSQRPHD